MSGGIMEYNGSAIVAMAGENCIAIAADKRYGVRQLQTVSCNRQKIFQLTDQTFVGLAGLATDVQTMSQLLDFRIKLYSLREERTMQPKTVGNLISSMLYEKRFGPWFTEPVVAGLDKEGKPFMCAFDFIGAMSKAEEKFNAGLFVHRAEVREHLQKAKTEFGGNTNFSAYRQGRDRKSVV